MCSGRKHKNMKIRRTNEKKKGKKNERNEHSIFFFCPIFAFNAMLTSITRKEAKKRKKMRQEEMKKARKKVVGG